MDTALVRPGLLKCPSRSIHTVTDCVLTLNCLLTVAMSSDFTMNALLAMSAAHLAWQTKNSDTDHLAYYHRGIALKGLHEALSTFSEHNSEAVLASSMLLSWQARDW